MSEFQGKHVLLKVESDDTPGTFERVCIFQNTQSISRSKQRSEYVVPSCDTPDDPPQTKRALQSLTDQITGDAYVTSEAVFGRLDAWHRGDTTKNIRLEAYQPEADGTMGAIAFTYSGAAQYTMNTVAAGYDQPMSLNSTLDFDGAMTYTTGAVV